MFVVFALIATLPLVALSYLAIAETRTALAEEVGRSHEDTARAAAAFVGAYVDTARATLIGAAARGNLSAADVRAIELQNPTFSSVVLLPAGDPLVTAPELLMAPTTNGTLVGRLNIGRLLVELQSFAHGNGESIILTDADGALLLAEPAPSGALVNWSNVEPVRRALQSEAGHVEFTDPVTQGASVAGFAPVPRLAWVVVDEVPTAVAYAALTRLTAVFIVLSGILVGAILLASVVLARRIVKPVRELTVAAGAVAAGRLATRIEPEGNDEIAGLANAFNEMAGRVSESLAGLRRSEARYRNLVESANDLIFTVERDGSLSFVGPLAERLLGYDARALGGRPLVDLVDAEDRERFERAMSDVLERSEPQLWIMLRMVAKGGARRVFRSNFSPIFGPDGHVERALLVASDVTELQEYAAELESRVEARTAELQAKSEEMESFLYSVSHDLKAPLISIEGYAQGLEEDYGALLEGDGKLYLERIRKNASLMERLILDILELSRIGRFREAAQEIDANEILALIAARVDDKFHEEGGRLEVQPNLPHLLGERNRIEQLFTNLVQNALKYRHPARPPIVRVEGERTNEGATIRVIDNGRGIPHGSQEQLFRIFQRLPTPTGMPDPGGTGMGLAIVKRIVDTHRGRIWVGSVEGEGSVFTVILPTPEAAK